MCGMYITSSFPATLFTVRDHAIFLPMLFSNNYCYFHYSMLKILPEVLELVNYRHAILTLYSNSGIIVNATSDCSIKFPMICKNNTSCWPGYVIIWCAYVTFTFNCLNHKCICSNSILFYSL